MKEFLYFAGLLAVIALLLLFTNRPATEPKLDIESYLVPSGQEQEIAAMLNRNFSYLSKKDEEKVARAEVVDNGKIIVFGPKSVQKSLESVIGHMRMTPQNEKETPTNYQATIWIVTSNPSSQDRNIPENLSAILKDAYSDLPGGNSTLSEQMSCVLGWPGNAELSSGSYEANLTLSRNPKYPSLRIYVTKDRHQILQTSLMATLGKPMVIGMQKDQSDNEPYLIFVLKIQEL